VDRIGHAPPGLRIDLNPGDDPMDCVGRYGFGVRRGACQGRLMVGQRCAAARDRNQAETDSDIAARPPIHNPLRFEAANLPRIVRL
jgi:hypothetical protein